MARIAGTDLPRDKRVEIGLTYIYGIGHTRADKILAKADVSPETKVRDLSEDEALRIAREDIESFQREFPRHADGVDVVVFAAPQFEPHLALVDLAGKGAPVVEDEVEMKLPF